MFKVNSDVLKNIVTPLVKSARKAGKEDKTIYIRTTDDMVSFYFHGAELSVEKKFPAQIESNLEVATSISELDVKVAALPNEVEVTVEKTIGGPVQFTWKGIGKRKSELKMDILPETSPMLEVPVFEETLNWSPGILHSLVRYIHPFTASNSEATRMPNCLGPNFSKDDTGRVIVRATDGIKGVTLYPKKIEWFDVPLSIHIASLQGVADVIPSDAEIQVGLSGGTSVIFKAGFTTAVCQTLVGKFPSIDPHYNTRTKGKMIIDRLELIKLCQRVKLLAPSAPVLQMQVVEDKVFAIVPGVLEQALPASVEGDLPCFGVGAVHMEMAAMLFAMLKSAADELTLYVDNFDTPISVVVEGHEDIRLFCAPYVSQFLRDLNSKKESKLVTV